MLHPKQQDAYVARAKPATPVVCPSCGVVFAAGRWVWKKAPARAPQRPCPACRRTADRYPAGYIELRGPFLGEHQEEILNLARNVERREKEHHPLERIMDIQKALNHTLITTTGVHLARGIADALARAFDGQMAFRFPQDEKSLQVYWQR